MINTVRISYHKPDCQNRECKNPRATVVYHKKKAMHLCLDCAVKACELMESQKPFPGFFTP